MSSRPATDSGLTSPNMEGNKTGATSASSSIIDPDNKKLREHRSSEYGQGGIEYDQGDYQAPALHYDPQSHPMQPLSAHLHRSTQQSQQTSQANYYDRIGVSRSAMTAYDPTLGSASVNAGSVRSRASSEHQPTSPTMTPYYSNQTIPSQQQMSPYLNSYAHYQAQPTNIDPSSTAYHMMGSMNAGEVNAVGGMQPIESHMHGVSGGNVAAPSLSVSSPQEQNMDPAMYYQQPFTSTQASGYRPQQGYYPSPASSSGQAAIYPNMMTGMQGYPQAQYPSQSYALQQQQQAQYAMNPYASQQAATANPAYYGNQRPGWTSNHWRPGNIGPNYYPYQPMPALPSSSSSSSSIKRPPHSAQSNRSKGQTLSSTNTLPMRPGSFQASTRTSSGPAYLEGVEGKRGPSPSDPSAEKDMKIPGKGLRPHYHPQQGPRSDFVLWCGNVPSDTNVEELWSFFSRLPPDSEENDSSDDEIGGDPGHEAGEEYDSEKDPAMSPKSGHGVLSVFIIARSNCAFVNYATPRHLQRAVNYFHGQTLRPADSRCPKLVCRVRKKDDEAQAGVAGQRGRGMHVAWVKEQDRKLKEKSRSKSGSGEGRHADTLNPKETSTLQRFAGAAPHSPSSSAATATTGSGNALYLNAETSTQANDESARFREQQNVPITSFQERSRVASASQESSSGSISYTSTNSSLFRHPAFQERFFILKSLGIDDLHRSVQTGLWATQPHNEQVLDQAYRNSEFVYLIFSANQSGGFYGYARMAGPILSSREKQQQQLTGTDASLTSPSSSGPSIVVRTPITKSDAIPEADEAKTEGSGATSTMPEIPSIDLSKESLEPMKSSSNLLSPGEGATLQGTMSSPQQLTPAGEVESPLPHMYHYENRTWPIQRPMPGEKEDSLDRAKRGHTLSPNTLLARPLPMGSITAMNDIPTLTATAPASDLGYDEDDQLPDPMLQIAIPPPQSDTPAKQNELVMDEQGVRRRDMAAFGMTSSSGSDGGSKAGGNGISLSQAGSLGPTDSASYPNAKQQNHLALQALIHNLRLEERESVIKAEELEKRMSEAGEGSDSGQTTTPRGDSSSDSWGKPFKVEWVKTTSLAFSQVRRLRNPWRDNRQVKVSRDGTELEPNVGRQLLKEWDRNNQEGNITATIGSTNNEDDEEDEDEDR